MNIFSIMRITGTHHVPICGFAAEIVFVLWHSRTDRNSNDLGLVFDNIMWPFPINPSINHPYLVERR